MAHSQHPIAIIQAALKMFTNNGNAKISSKTTTEEFEKLEKKINQKLKDFDSITKSAVEAATADAHILQSKRNGKSEVMMSYIDEDFLKTYSEELDEKTAEEILAVLSQIIGTTTKVQRQEMARAKLSEISRRVNEPFTLFLQRCSNLIKKITEDSTIQKYLVEIEFKRHISPTLMQYILDQDKPESIYNNNMYIIIYIYNMN